MTTPLKLEAVTKSFGEGDGAVRAVDAVDLEVAEGEIVLVMGPSGSGKTTLLAMAGGLMRPTEGRVWLGEHELTAMSERELPAVRLRKVGFIFQSANLLMNLSAVENVRIVVEAAGVGPAEADERARRLLGSLRLDARADSLPEKLSGGERQRVGIARALANDPGLLLCDEPTANLDSRAGYQLMHTLELLAKDAGKSVVAVTHDQRIVDVADRVLWLEDGRLTDTPPEAAKMVTDPVCGMRIDPTRAAGTRRPGRRTLAFCSDICMERFDADPEGFVPKPTRRSTRKAPAKKTKTRQ